MVTADFGWKFARTAKVGLVERLLGATLEILDFSGMPPEPVRPNRLAFGTTGLGIGLLLGTLGWWLQQSRTQKQQAA